MFFLILSILCSVTVGIIFKMAQRASVSTTQMVASNYIFALLLCFGIFHPDWEALGATAPWGIYGAIGVLLPTVFLLMVASIKHMGIVKTDAAQRLSLFIPILAAWLIFGEEFTKLKTAALFLGIPALGLILAKPDANTKKNWGYPAAVLLGFGIIDVLFKQLANFTQLPYTTSLTVVFGIAGVIMLAVVAYERVFMNRKGNSRSSALGILVGFFNFGNILFYLKAHQEFAENPSTVFAAMNMGVIIVGSLVGILIFKEKIGKRNFAGLLLALLAIFLIAFSQKYK